MLFCMPFFCTPFCARFCVPVCARFFCFEVAAMRPLDEATDRGASLYRERGE